MTLATVAERISIQGLVQGVGFRPLVWRLANELGLVGRVGNDNSGVFIEVAGTGQAVDRLVARIDRDAPPGSRVDRLVRASMATADSTDIDDHFHIVDSKADALTGRRRPSSIPPDVATCDDCLVELFDRSNRRYRHPFITCTRCGPRYTIITSMPYDRANTTMDSFAPCSACDAEYRDPGDRRYHAQPISCHDCGPTLTYRMQGRAGPEDDPTVAASKMLLAGAIVAIRGLGGYHLACDATNDQAVSRLRAAKRRPDKPLAVMVADVATSLKLGEVESREVAELRSPAAPIVLLRARSDTSVSSLVHPDNPLIGSLLAYTPLHHLLLAACRRPLVMTSANRSGEPLASSRQELDDMTGLFDAVLDHDRPIETPCDDSVVRIVGDEIVPLRRARGYAPIQVPMPAAKREVLAVGSDLKNTFCLVSGGAAIVSQHIGDVENVSTIRALDRLTARAIARHHADPTVVVADAHPQYRSTGWARRRHPDRICSVQHHHAHVASVLAEHGIPAASPTLGFAFDGTGFGADGSTWGGELLLADADGFRRLAHLKPIALPGGDGVVRRPCLQALAYLWAAGVGWDPRLPPVAHLRDAARSQLRTQLERGIGCVETTSMGRLFDAVASLAGLRHEITFEAQAAIDLEIAAEEASVGHHPYRFALAGPIADPSPVIASVTADRLVGVSASTIARAFHDAVIELVCDLAEQHRWRVDRPLVVLSGGVFQNRALTVGCRNQLAERGFDVLTNRIVPPNDGGLALGQAYIAAHRKDA